MLRCFDASSPDLAVAGCTSCSWGFQDGEPLRTFDVTSGRELPRQRTAFLTPAALTVLYDQNALMTFDDGGRLSVRNHQVETMPAALEVTASCARHCIQLEVNVVWRLYVCMPNGWRAGLQGQQVTSFEDHVLFHGSQNCNVYISRDQTFVLSFCKVCADRPELQVSHGA